MPSNLRSRIALPRYSSLYAAFVLGLLLLQIFFWVSPTHQEAVSIIYLWPAGIALVCVTAYRGRHNLPDGMPVLLGMVCWTYLTCVLNGDYYLTYNRQFMLGVVLALGVCYPTFLLMEGESRRRWLTGFAVALTAALSLLVWFSVYAVATNTLLYTPLSTLPLGITDAIYAGRLNVFYQHPNGIACTFSIGLFLAVYLFFHGRGKLPLQLWGLLAAVSMYIGIALTVSRTVMLTVCMGFGALAILVAQKLLPPAPGKKRFWLWAAAALAAMALAYAGYSAIIKLFAALAARAEAVSVAARPFDDLLTFNLRTPIWGAALRRIGERPITLLIGMLDSEVARLPITMLNRYATYHLHNMPLEVLMETGLPGLALCLCFLWKVVTASVRLFFQKAAPFAVRVLPILPCMLLVNGLMEAYPFLGGRIMDMLFFVLAGAVIACDRQYALRP